MDALLRVYLGLFQWLARRLYGPMPGTEHLDPQQQAQLRDALVRHHRTNIAIWLTIGVAFLALVVIGFATERIETGSLLLILTAGMLAVVFLGPIIVVLDYGRQRRILIGELRRLAPLPVCPRCGYDLRTSPDRCPACGTSTSMTY